MTTAEVMTFAIISGLHDHADYRIMRLVASQLQYFPKILSLVIWFEEFMPSLNKCGG
jgi:hypothetical protein